MTEFLYLYRGGEAAASAAEGQQQMQQWMAWMKELGEKGHLKAVGSPLEKTGKLVSGKAKVVSDGPFAEAKEIVGGFWIWQVSSMEEAVEWLKRAPFRGQTVDLRRIMEPADLEGQLPQEVVDAEARLRAQTEVYDGS